VLDAAGRIVAQGCRRLCELVAAGVSIFSEQGRLI
jgi:hypothetical protein